MTERPPASFRQQLRASIVRNLRLKIRDSRKTTAEIFLPLYTLGTLIVLKILIPNPNFPAILEPHGTGKVFEQFDALKNHTVAVVQNGNGSRHHTVQYLDAVNNLYSSMHPASDTFKISWQFYDNQSELIAAYWRDPYSMPLALVFHNDDPYNGQLDYEIRTNPSFYVAPSTTELFSNPVSCRQNDDNYLAQMIPIEMGDACPVNQYYYSGFIALQTLLDYTKISLTSSCTDFHLPTIFLEMFPKEPYTGNWLVAFRVVIPIYMVMALSQFITYLLILIVGEKEKHIKEGLKIIGLRDSVFWAAWFAIYGVFVTFLTLVSVVLLFTLGVFQYTNYFPVFLLILLYSLSVIVIGFMITPFFDNSRTAGILGNFIVNIMSLFYFIQVFLDSEETSAALWIVSLISPTGFALAMDKIMVLDIKGEGVTLSNLWSGPGIPLGGSILMMAFDIILYSLLALYLDAVVPSEHGTKQTPCFCFYPSFWITKKEVKVPLLNGESTVNSFNNYEADVEPVPREMRGREAIKIVDLVKVFNTCCNDEPVTAINGINLTIYEGQITAILGHNGAGKSTLFNVMTGLTSPTYGTCYVFGYDIRNHSDMTMIRRMTGVCPQHDILFDDLTPREHLYFFAAVRGIDESEIESEVTKTIKDCDLGENSDTVVKHLSGGQKRKLSVGIAIIGDPRIIIFDEPTAGVDPYSRRCLWQLLQSIKKGKVILLTTHFMDEADILADRKAVITQGRLRCCGTSLFLKNKFGIGYHLTLVLDLKARTTPISNLINLHVPKAEKARHHGRELSYILPHDAVHNFAPLFSDIEGSTGQQLGILSYGVSMTTLEEVFLQLENDKEGEDYESHTKIVQSRAISRSMSLQGRSGSSTSVVIEPTESYDMKGTIRSLPERKSMAYAVEHIEIDTSDEPPLIRSNESAIKSSWMELDDITLQPSIWSITYALLKLRVTILIRDLQRLYLMILVPLLCCGVGLYLNSIQVVTPTMRSILLNNDTYEDAKIAVIGNYNKNPNEIFNAMDISNFDDGPETGPGDYIDDPPVILSSTSNAIIDELRKLINIDESFTGSYALFLNFTPHMAAFNFTSATCSNMTLTVLYNDTAMHSLPVALNILSNAIYRTISPSEDIRPIEVQSHPLMITAQSQEFNIGTFSTALFIGMIFVLIPVSLAIDMVYDREMQAKNQLRVNGLAITLYFTSFFVVIFGLTIIICIFLLIMVFAMDIPSFQHPSALVTIGLFIIIYSPSAILCSTCSSYFFDKTDSALTFLPNILTFAGCVPFILVAFLDMMGIDAKATILLHYFLSILNPMYIPYALIYFVDRIYIACSISNACSNLTIANYMTEEIIVILASSLLHIPIWSVCLMIADIKKNGGKIRDLIKRKKNELEEPVEEYTGDYEDSDVKMEREKVAKMSMCEQSDEAGQPIVIVKNLRKDFKESSLFSSCCTPGNGEKTTTAIRCLSFAVEPGEVLGLLGHNGAGKTTTLRVMTGEIAATKGQINIGGKNITSSHNDVFKMMGYCPQYDALWKNVTVREHLEVYAAIRGVGVKDRKRLINTYLHGLHITEHANKQTRHLSGGTKRKLSYAIAMLGSPKIVLLDEPSTGMDPKSKRFLWDTILASFQGSRGAILTTHAMEEADALCSKVGIMAKGELRCLGSTQHLKNLYGAGYNLEVKLKHLDALHTSSSFDNIQVQAKKECKNFVFEMFPNAKIEESFGDRIVCSIPQDNVSSLAQCFEKLEKGLLTFF
ncbi:hypothetical protein ACKWTF_014662 [Chironomus riparius]